MNNADIKQHLREAIEYIESMQDSIECGMNELGQEVIYGLMDKGLEFDIKAAKALLQQLEGGEDE